MRRLIQNPSSTGFTRHKQVAIGLVVLVNLLCGTVSLYSQSKIPEATLYGSIQPNEQQIRFYWETRNWPVWLYGYQLKSRDGMKSPWIELHSNAIPPSFQPDRDWSNQGLEPDEVSQLLKIRTETFGQRLPDRPTEEVVKLLRQFDGLQSGDRLAQKQDFNIALYSGFAFVEHFTGPVENMLHKEYGLFPVGDDGKASDEPVSVWQAKDLLPETGTVEIVKQRVQDGVVVLSWDYSRNLARNNALFGFSIYREDQSTGQWIPLVKTPIGNVGSNDLSLQFQFYDTEGNPTIDQNYAIIGETMFQESFGRTVVAFDAERHLPLPRPVIGNHTVVNDADVLLSWGYSKESLERVKGFYVERSFNGEFKRISNLLPSEQREFVDKGEKHYASIYDYRLVAVDSWGKEWTGTRLPLLYLGRSRPPQPTGLTGSFTAKDGEYGIMLEWTPTPATDKRTSSFRIANDLTEPGNLLLQSQIAPIKGNRYFHPLPVNGGRWVNIGVTPFTEEGISGESAKVAVYVPTIQLPPVTGVAASFDHKEYAVELTWKYPDDYSDLSGFRVLLNDAPILNAEDLDAESRSAVIESDLFERGKTFRFTVLALGGIDDSSPSIPALVWIQKDRLPDGIEMPEGLAVDIRKNKEGRVSAGLTWEVPEDLEEKGLLGYALMVDYAQEGNVRRLNSLPPLVGPEFEYVLPEIEDRKNFTFRIAAITKENKLGPFAEAILQLPENLQEEGNRRE